VDPTGKAIARFGTKSQGQGHETTYAQIVAEELWIPASDIVIEEGDTDTAPYGLGTYASRSTPVAGAAGAMAARKIRDKEDRGPPARGGRGGSRVGDREVLGQGRAAEIEDHPGDRLRRVHQPSAGDGGGARGDVVLRPAEPDLPLRQLHLRGGHRPRHRHGQSAASWRWTTAATSSTR
jgi:CO/xanthine dehydrogenase Mo-binding subunit